MMPILIFLSLLFFPQMARAIETLRIAILEDVPELQLAAPEDIIISTPSGKRVGSSRLPTLQIGIRNGLTVNGYDTEKGSLVFRPRHGGGIRINGRPYGGEILIQKRPTGLLAVNEIDLEQYLLGVVPAEMPPSWHMEALKAQAVISRTYALYQKRERVGEAYDLVASTLSQVYEGERAIHPRASDAVRQTAGQILTYEGAPALTFFHSTSAGPTENATDHFKFSEGASLPYLAGVSCPLDQDSPYYHWERTIAFKALEEALQQQGHSVGAIADALPIQWSRAGRVLRLRIRHASGETILKADDLRKAIGFRALPSTRFTLRTVDDNLVFQGMGYGHGVGLCQWGAGVMARRGVPFEEILQHYYPGTRLQSA